MRALVTGGAGFIGSTLVDRLLAEDYAVDVVDDLSGGSLTNLAGARHDHPRQLTFHRLDIRSTDMVEVMARRRPDVVYHLAARTGSARSLAEPVADAETNVLGARQVIDSARACGAGKVVFASSAAAIHGPLEARDLPVKESHHQQPTSPHGVAKKAVFDYLWTYRQQHSLEFTALALANVYGPRQRTDGTGGVVGSFAARLLDGEACTLDGGGRQTRDFVYVDDVVDALARAAQRGSGLLLNVGTGTETSIVALHQMICAATGVEREPRTGPAGAGELGRSSVDPSRAGIHLGWKHWTTLTDGVAAVVESLAGR
jgi:UDP-glucose 4-epimerase